MVTKRSCFFLFWEGITVFKSFVYCIIFKEAPKNKREGVESCRVECGKHVVFVYPARHSKEIYLVCCMFHFFLMNNWYNYILYVTILLLSFASRSSKKKIKRWKKTQKKIPWRCRPTNKLGPHVGLAIGSQCWSATDGHSGTELPKASCLSIPMTFGYQSLSIHFTTGEKKTITQKPFPKKSDLHPFNQDFAILRIHMKKHPCYIYIPSAPKKPTSFVKYPGFPLSPPPASHQTQLSPGFLQSLCLSQWLNLEPVDLIKQNGWEKETPSNH